MRASLDANRERVVARDILPSVIVQLQTEPWLALPVLNNILADYGRIGVTHNLQHYESSRSCRARTRGCEKTRPLSSVSQLIDYLPR